MTTIQFNPEMLVLARESRGFSQTQLAEEAKVKQGTISKIESGALLPSPELLDKFCLALKYQKGLFYQWDRIYGFNSTVFFHRKRQSLPDRTLRKLHSQMNLTRMRISRMLRSTELNVARKFQRLNPEEYGGRVDVIAKLVRSTWGIPTGPVANVMRAIEDAGGFVVTMDFETRQADAISEWVPPFPPIFLVNSNAEITGDRLRLTLAHEIAHVVMHEFPSPEMEKEANAFASEFLMPRKEIKPSLYALSFAKLIDLKAYWKVSMAALVQRAYELKTITDSQRRYMFIQFSRRGIRLREPSRTDVPIESPELLDEMIRVHMDELNYTPTEMAQILMFLEEMEFRDTYLEKRRMRLVG